MKNIRILIVAVVALFSMKMCFAVDAAKTSIETRMLTEDRVWEYVIEELDSNTAYYDLTRYAIRGTVEKFGREYQCLYRLGMKSWKVEFKADGDYEVSFFGDDNNSSWVALLREEGDKVYILLDRINGSYIEIFNPENTAVNNGFSWENVPDGEETLLYDFSLNEEESARCNVRYGYAEGPLYTSVVSPVTVCEVSNEASPYGHFLKRISLINPVTINWFDRVGNPIEVTKENVDTYGIVWLQGVGSVGHGILNEPGGYHGMPRQLGYDCMEVFNNLYDSQGNVLYPGRGIQYGESGIARMMTCDSNRRQLSSTT